MDTGEGVSNSQASLHNVECTQFPLYHSIRLCYFLRKLIRIFRMTMNIPFLQPFWGAFKSPRQISSTIKTTRLLFFILILVIVIPTLASGEANCTCERDGEEETNNNKTNEALKYKVAAIASILVAGAIGVCLPVAGRTVSALSPDKDVFFLIKAFAAGVILATGFIHVLPDAFDHLTSPCLTEKIKAFSDFPFTGFVAMISAIVTLMIDVAATTYFAAAAGNNADNDDEGGLHTHTHVTHGHAHGSAATLASRHSSNSKDLIRHRVIAQVLELGIVVHSVIIGISLGASQSPREIRPLVVALSFHQFFEGMGLGGCITQAKFKCRAVVIMALFFSLTTPVGIAIGIGITKGYDEDSETALIVEGTLNAASAGILIYMALVDLLADDFMNPKMQTNRKLQLGANASLLLGAGLMALLAKWA